MIPFSSIMKSFNTFVLKFVLSSDGIVHFPPLRVDKFCIRYVTGTDNLLKFGKTTATSFDYRVRKKFELS
jgi:hypothetical protein